MPVIRRTGCACQNSSRRESRISAVRLPDSAWQAKAAPSARNSDTQPGSQAVTATGFDPVIGGSNPPPAATFTAVPCDAGITTSPQDGEMSARSISPHQHGTAFRFRRQKTRCPSGAGARKGVMWNGVLRKDARFPVDRPYQDEQSNTFQIIRAVS